MNLVYGLALLEFSIAQWIERPPGVWKVIGSNPVGDSDFSLSHTRDMLINSFSHLFHRAENLPSFILSLIFSFPPWGVLRTHNWPALPPVGLNSSFGFERYIRIRKDKASIPG